MRAGSISTLLSTFLGLAALYSAGSASAQEPPRPEALDRLDRLAGSWTTDRVEFFSAEGAVSHTSAAVSTNEFQMDGLVMSHRGRLANPALETRGWFFWDPVEEQLRLGSVSTGGRYDEFVGAWEGDQLVLTMLPHPAFEGRSFRIVYSEVTDDTYLERLEVSTDGGATWRVSSRQRMHRSAVAAWDGAEAVLESMGTYTGTWTTDPRTDGQGPAFHFEYSLEWLDPGRTVAEMRIIRESDDGTRAVVFTGFKGLDVDGNSVYYVASSPSGRGARGDVVLEGDRLVTRYVGWSPTGDVVHIRDVFEPVAGNRFLSTTYLRANVGEAWRMLNEDRWARIDP